jgi:HEAT repeat protein
VGLADPSRLAGLAGDERPLLSREILRLLVLEKSGRGIPHLSVFLALKNRDLRLDAVRVLGEIGNERANRILMGFLEDKDEGVRVQAALNLNPRTERSRIHHLIGEASSPKFDRKSLKEKQAILSFLGRTRTDEAFSFLRRTLEKGLFWPWAGRTELRLSAIAGLECMGTADALEVLEKSARARNRPVREASAQALQRLAGGTSAEERTEP